MKMFRILAIKILLMCSVSAISSKPVPAQTLSAEPPILVFKGNSRVSDKVLLDNFTKCSKGSRRTYDPPRYEYYSDICIRRFLWSKGFLKAVVRENAAFEGKRYVVNFAVEEGPRFRWGEITFQGVKPEHATLLLNQFGQKKGDVADASRLLAFLFDKLHADYAERGYIQYAAEMDPPQFIDPPDPASDGTANVLVTIDPGSQFRVNRVLFIGIGPDENKKLVDSFPLKKNEIFARSRLYAGIERVSRLGRYETVDIDAEVELRVDEESKNVDVVILLRQKKK